MTIVKPAFPTAAASLLLAAAVCSLEACSYRCDPPCVALVGPGLLAPSDGATGVPTDALIWIGDLQVARADAGAFKSSAAAITVSGPNGPISGSSNRITFFTGNGAITVFRPSSPLAPETVFTVTVNGGLVATFTTGSATTGPAPAVPQVKQSVQHSEPFTCFFDSNTFSMTAPGLLVVAQFEGEEPAFNVSVPSGQLRAFTPAGSGARIDFDQGGCGNWDGSPARARFATFDIAGQFSGWTGWFTLS
jgi:hypothetical protein